MPRKNERVTRQHRPEADIFKSVINTAQRTRCLHKRFVRPVNFTEIRRTPTINTPPQEEHARYPSHLDTAGQHILCTPDRLAEILVLATRSEVERLPPPVLVEVGHQVVEAARGDITAAR